MQRLLTDIAGFLARRRMGFITHWAIRRYMKHYQVSLDEALLPNVQQYKCFNDFFTRQLKEGARPICPEPHTLCSPAEGLIVQAGQLSNKQWRIKGNDYSLAELLTSDDLCQRYQHGYSINIYLSPKDYHRVHMPYDGLLKQSIYVKGSLYSVNPEHRHAHFINKNERLICEFYNEDIGHFIVMFIGALIVGSIHTAWDDIANHDEHIGEQRIQLRKGSELGYFQLGSSILLITEKDYQPTSLAKEQSSIRMGQAILTTDTDA